MTGIERVQRILARKKVDRVAVYENFWIETVELWTEQGYIKQGEHLSDHFGFDIERIMGIIDFSANLPEKVIEETDETILKFNNNGVLTRTFKKKSGASEYLEYTITDRKSWKDLAESHLAADKSRINSIDYKNALSHAHERNKFFLLVNNLAYSLGISIIGFETMLISMYEDPEWMRDVISTYCELIIAQLEILFTYDGKPDGIYFTEDIAMNDRPLFSPEMYKEFVMPSHKKVFDFVHSFGIPVIIHCCGNADPLVPYFVEAGIDCLQPMQRKAGMDPLKFMDQYGDKISFMGGIDTTVINTNDRNKINEDLKRIIPALMKNYGYILQSDHSIPQTITYDTYRFFLDRGLEIGSY